MKITWLGHSSFKIEENGYTVITDPYEPGSVPGLKDIDETANMVLCSHEHGDHNYRKAVKLISTQKTAPEITKIESWHDEVKGAKRGSNNIHIIDFGSCRIAHLGDIGCELEVDQIKALTQVDVVLIPVGGFYTIDGKQAAALVKILKPKIVIPMHYRDDEKNFGYPVISDISDFTDAMGKTVKSAGSAIDYEQVPKQDAETQVIIMQPQNL